MCLGSVGNVMMLFKLLKEFNNLTSVKHVLKATGRVKNLHFNGKFQIWICNSVGKLTRLKVTTLQEGQAKFWTRTKLKSLTIVKCVPALSENPVPCMLTASRIRSNETALLLTFLIFFGILGPNMLIH